MLLNRINALPQRLHDEEEKSKHVICVIALYFYLFVGNNQLVFVNFYADWCRFSRMLAPVFEEASNIVAREYVQPGAVLFAKVDCDNQRKLDATVLAVAYALVIFIPDVFG